MPRKTKTEASILQNRESQRRSRARRRDLVDDLKRRLEEYEKRDALASLEMQRAARAVNAENQSLRTLLWRNGVSQVEVDRFLAAEGTLPMMAWEEQPAAGDATAAIRRPSVDGYTTTLPHHIPGHKYTHSEPANLAGYPMALTPGSVASQHPSSVTPLSHDILPKSAGFPPPPVKYEDSEGTETISSPTTEGYATGATTPQMNGSNSMESSCDAAAAILVQLHKQADPLAARAALGCSGRDTCAVKNTTLFQLMEGYS